MENYAHLEEEILVRMYHSFLEKYDLPPKGAAELALEVLEILKESNSNLFDIKNYIYQ